MKRIKADKATLISCDDHGIITRLKCRHCTREFAVDVFKRANVVDHNNTLLPRCPLCGRVIVEVQDSNGVIAHLR